MTPDRISVSRVLAAQMSAAGSAPLKQLESAMKVESLGSAKMEPDRLPLMRLKAMDTLSSCSWLLASTNPRLL